MLAFRLSQSHIMEEQSITVIWNQFVSEKSSVHHGWAVIIATKSRIVHPSPTAQESTN